MLARVLVSLKIFPSDIEVNLDALKKEIEVIAHILIPEDKTGGIEEVESSLKKMEKINELQTLMVRRV